MTITNHNDHNDQLSEDDLPSTGRDLLTNPAGSTTDTPSGLYPDPDRDPDEEYDPDYPSDDVDETNYDPYSGCDVYEREYLD
jgi:hypothetical protein